jgi:hypothetical protein
MNNKITLFFAIIIANFSFAQVSNDSTLTAKVKAKLIYYQVSDGTSNQQYKTNSGQVESGPTNRTVSIRFKVGTEGEMVKLDKKGNGLKSIFKKDAEAMAQFNDALKIRRKMRYFNLAEAGCGIAAVTLGVIATSKYSSDKRANEYMDPGEEKQKSKGRLLLAVGSVGSLVPMYYFYFKCDRLLDDYKVAVLKSIETYNTNIILTSKKSKQ